MIVSTDDIVVASVSPRRNPDTNATVVRRSSDHARPERNASVVSEVMALYAGEDAGLGGHEVKAYRVGARAVLPGDGEVHHHALPFGEHPAALGLEAARPLDHPG